MYIRKKDILSALSKLMTETVESEGIPLNFGERLREIREMAGAFNSIPFEKFGHVEYDMSEDDTVGGN